MSEAAFAALDWHFQKFPDTPVLSGALDANPASLNVLRKLGFSEPHPYQLSIRSRGQDLPGTRVRLTREAFDRQGRPVS